jgi:putative Mn2+ efflux pump MntP
MTLIAIIFIALGLAMDAFAVSISSGAVIKKMHIKHAFLIACFFGFFQAIMPLLGWVLANFAGRFLENFGHWIAFVLLVFIGAKMIYESFKMSEERDSNPLNIYVLFVMAIATSIDAFAVGITLSALKVQVLLPILIIGLITFVFSFLGAYIGKLFGHIFESKVEVFGGVILILIGIKVLVTHFI